MKKFNRLIGAYAKAKPGYEEWFHGKYPGHFWDRYGEETLEGKITGFNGTSHNPWYNIMAKDGRKACIHADWLVFYTAKLNP